MVCILAWRYFTTAARAFDSQYNDLGIIQPPRFPVKFCAIAVLIGAIAMALVIGLWLMFAFER